MSSQTYPHCCAVCAAPVEPGRHELADPNTGETLQFCSAAHLAELKAAFQNEILITHIAAEGALMSLNVPPGELAYWSGVVRKRTGCDVLGIAWNVEVPHLPYLGHIARPNAAQAWAEILEASL